MCTGASTPRRVRRHTLVRQSGRLKEKTQAFQWLGFFVWRKGCVSGKRHKLFQALSFRLTEKFPTRKTTRCGGLVLEALSDMVPTRRLTHILGPVGRSGRLRGTTKSLLRPTRLSVSYTPVCPAAYTDSYGHDGTRPTAAAPKDDFLSYADGIEACSLSSRNTRYPL